MNEKEYQDHVLNQVKEADETVDVPHTRTFSVNNRLICEPYTSDKTLKAAISGGIARPEQKTAVKGLKLLADAHIKQSDYVSSIIVKGSIVYIREETLHTQKWSTNALNCDAIEGPFIMVSLSDVEFVVSPRL